MIRKAICRVSRGKDLSESAMRKVMQEIMTGAATPAQIGAFLIALRIKGETISEITGAAKVMREKATPVSCKRTIKGGELVDIVGTGGDGAGTFNVSTTSAFVAAGAGLKIAKHGNRAVSSGSGSADLIEALGVPLDISPVDMAACVDRVGIGFLFAPVLHQAMKHALSPRREIGMRSVFNLLGPLTNPAEASALLVGVYDQALVQPLTHVLDKLGVKSAMVVHGEGGYDEITITGITRACLLKDGQIKFLTIDPRQFGLRLAKPEDIQAKDPDSSRRVFLRVLEGRRDACRDMVILNAAAAIFVAGKATGLKQGVDMARHSIDQGLALRKVEELKTFANSLKTRAA